MSDTFITNFITPNTSALSIFFHFWKLTRAMKKSGWNVVSHSNGTTKVAAGSNANDSWGNNIDPLADPLPTFTSSAAWIVLRGPSTIKVILSAPPTGNFLKGEQVTQAVTGATGEITGVVWDTLTNAGWAVIFPRTGTFNNINNISGDISTASISISDRRTFVREIMLFKSTDLYQGQLYYICADDSSETSQLFSTLASSTGCTATVGPGMGGSGNTFPANAICIRGTGGTTTNTGLIGSATTALSYSGYSNILVKNIITSNNISADGSFTLLINGTSNSGVLDGFYILSFMRLDNTEPGDTDPFVWVNTNNNATNAVAYRTTSTGGNPYSSWTNAMQSSANGLSPYKGYTARGCPETTRDLVVGFTQGLDMCFTSSSVVGVASNAAGLPYTLQNTPNTKDLPLIKTNINLYSTDTYTNIRMFKGTLRWLQVCSIGNVKDLFDNMNAICVCSYTSNSPSIVLNMWDGQNQPF